MKNRGVFQKILYSILFLIAVTAVYLTTFTSAKWSSLVTGADRAQVAVFALDVSDVSSNELELDCNNGVNEASYQFAVANQKNGAVSEVSMKYTIQVALPEKMPEGLTMTIDGVTGTLDPSGKTCSFTAAGWVFEPGVEETRFHTLTVSADPNLVDSNLDLAAVSVGITAEQTETSAGEVVVKIPKSLSVTKMPNKTGYINNENFESDGMEVTVTYTDNTTAVVSNYKIGNVKLTIGDTAVTIRYSENGITTETSVPVAVGYEITYDANLGLFENGGTTNTVRYLSDSTVMPGSNSYQEPERIGYAFAGWYKNANCTSGNEFDRDNVTTNGTVYAKWDSLNYTITYDSNGGDAVSIQNYSVSSNVTLAAAPTREGYTFTGWKLATEIGGWSAKTYTASENVGTGKYGDVTLVAQWTPIAYTITYNVNGGNTVADQSYNITTDVTLAAAPAREGYTFTGWKLETETGGWSAKTYTASENIGIGKYGDIALVAQWNAIDYTITYNLDGGTVVTANPASYNVESGTITLNNPTKEGYIFLGWTGSNGDTAQTTVTISIGSTGNKSFTANWKVLPTAYAVYSADDKSLTFYKTTDTIYKGGTYNGKSVTAVYKGFDTKIYSNYRDIPWYTYASAITSVKVADEGIAPKSTMNWFYNFLTCSNFDLSKLDTSDTTNMGWMFQYAGKNATALSIDLSGWNVSSVTNMKAMFWEAGTKATTWDIDLSGWNVSSVTDMSDMFYRAGPNVTTWDIGDLSGWNVSSVTNMESMFSNAGSNATTWDIGDLSGWNVSSVTNMESMFSSAGQNATTWDIGDLSGWNVSSVTNMESMFYLAGYKATYYMDLSKWNVTNVTTYGSFNVFVSDKIIAPAFGTSAATLSLARPSVSDTSTTTMPQTTPEATYRNPLTGEILNSQTTRRPYAVVINNLPEALPQHGVNSVA